MELKKRKEKKSLNTSIFNDLLWKAKEERERKRRKRRGRGKEEIEINRKSLLSFSMSPFQCPAPLFFKKKKRKVDFALKIYYCGAFQQLGPIFLKGFRLK